MANCSKVITLVGLMVVLLGASSGCNRPQMVQTSSGVSAPASNVKAGLNPNHVAVMKRQMEMMKAAGQQKH